MSTQQHLDIVQLSQFVVVDGNKSHLTQAFALHAVVYDVAQAIQSITLGQLLLSFLYRSSHSKTETTATIYFNTKHSSIVQNKRQAGFALQ